MFLLKVALMAILLFTIMCVNGRRPAESFWAAKDKTSREEFFGS
jgi:hypothetical protein